MRGWTTRLRGAGLIGAGRCVACSDRGNVTVAEVWGDMVRYMPQGLPAAGDEGLDHTFTWGRTYWGGALCCLLRSGESDGRGSLGRHGSLHAAGLAGGRR